MSLEIKNSGLLKKYNQFWDNLVLKKIFSKTNRKYYGRKNIKFIFR